MTYRIHNYKEEYLESQYDIGNLILSNWSGAGMTRIEILKKIYSKDNFDPNSKFYAFKDDKMVGYCTTTLLPDDETGIKKARMEFPIVLKEHEEAEIPLLTHAYDYLRKRGVNQVESRVSEAWGKTTKFAEKLEYEYIRDTYTEAKLNLQEIKILNENDYLEYSDEVLDDIIKFYIINLGTTEDQLKPQIDFILNNPDRIVAWIYYKDTMDKILSNSVIYNLPNDKTIATSSNPVIAKNVENREVIRNSMIKQSIQIAKERGVNELRFYINTDEIESDLPYYESLGADITRIKMYVKNL